MAKAPSKVGSVASKAGRSAEDRKRSIETAVLSIEKQFGKGAIMMLGTSGPAESFPSIPSGAPSLDVALGIGGYPRGRVIEIYGPESSGKTTLALHAVANSQMQGGIAAFIDAEHALDVGYAGKLGVRTEELLVSQPDTGEQALEIADMLVRSGAVEIVVIDSVAALVPRAEIEGEMGDAHVGLQARLMSQALRKLTGTLAKSHTAMVFINQVRMKIGVMFGNPETTPGGNALKFYASVRLDVRRIGQIKDGNDAIGNRTRVKVVKNKCAAPFRQAEFDIMFNQGISREGDILDMAAEAGIVEKSGTWFSFETTRIGQGRENAKQFLRDNPDIYDRIAEAVYARAGIKQAAPVDPDAAPADQDGAADL
jgi:recombination protein RecA